MFRFLRRKSPPNVPQQIYGAVVAQARQPAFYGTYGFEDTVMGRFGVLVLHLFLLSNRLAGEIDPRAARLTQDVFDCFTDDLDRALREIGIGDTSVPKRKQRMVAQFYALIDELAKPLDRGDVQLLAQRVAARYFAGVHGESTAALTRYLVETKSALAARTFDAICEGSIDWPDVANSRTMGDQA